MPSITVVIPNRPYTQSHRAPVVTTPVSSISAFIKKRDAKGSSEVNASASSFVGVGEVGVMALLSPALTLRAVGGFRAGPSVDELSWKVDDTTSGTIELAEPLSPTGPSAGLSGAWTF